MWQVRLAILACPAEYVVKLGLCFMIYVCFCAFVAGCRFVPVIYSQGHVNQYIYIYWLLYIYILYDIIDWLIIDNYVYTYNYIFEHAFSFTWVFSPQHFLFHSCPRIGCSWGVHRSTWAALVLIGYLRLSGRRVTCQLATLNVWRPDTVQDWLNWGPLPWRESEGTQK